MKTALIMMTILGCDDSVSQCEFVETPSERFVSIELSQVGFASWYGFPIYEPRTFITSGYQGTLGNGFPTALGAQVVSGGPGRQSSTGSWGAEGGGSGSSTPDWRALIPGSLRTP